MDNMIFQDIFDLIKIMKKEVSSECRVSVEISVGGYPDKKNMPPEIVFRIYHHEIEKYLCWRIFLDDVLLGKHNIDDEGALKFIKQECLDNVREVIRKCENGEVIQS